MRGPEKTATTPLNAATTPLMNGSTVPIERLMGARDDALRAIRIRRALGIATVVCLLATICADVTARSHLSDAMAWVEHTGEARVAIADAQRRFAEVRAAHGAQDSFAQARASVDRIGEITRDNSRQQGRWLRIASLLESAAAKGARGGDETLAEPLQLLADMASEENTLMSARVRDESAAKSQNTGALLLSALLTAFLALVGRVRMAHELDAMRGISETDELTALPNRRAFLARADERRDARAPFAVLFADVNGLKAINDGLGHEWGDKAIVAAAEVLRRTLRDGDFVSRLGGDEFAALLPKATEATVGHVVRRLRGAVDDYNREHSGAQFRLSISFGVACFDPSAPSSAAQLLADADAAMYEAKRTRIPSHSRVQAARAA